jgi:hypothetical protein
MQTERKSSQARAAGSRPSRGPSHVVEGDFALALKSAKAFWVEAHELYKTVVKTKRATKSILRVALAEPRRLQRAACSCGVRNLAETQIT